jgi:general secretion pathway protein G
VTQHLRRWHIVALAAIGASGILLFAALALSPRMICHLRDQREAFVLATMNGLREVIVESGSCPRTTDGLAALVQSGQLPKVPLDAWGNPYEYKTDGLRYTLTSFGGDGMEGGNGAAADIRQTFLCPSN